MNPIQQRVETLEEAYMYNIALQVYYLYFQIICFRALLICESSILHYGYFEIQNQFSEMLDVQSRNQPLQEHPIATMRRRRIHNISDPGFAPKQSLRPPISDSIQLSRRSRQFNFWTHLYPRNLSEPCIVTRDEPALDSSKQSRPPVFTSIDDFQKRYGSCYARTMPVRRRLPVRPASRPSSAPGSPQMKRVQFAPTDDQLQPLHDDSKSFLNAISRGSRGNANLLSSRTLLDNSRKVVDNQENHLDLCEPERILRSPSLLELESGNIGQFQPCVKFLLLLYGVDSVLLY